jgi:type IV pilus assembly protein PilQ
MPSQIKHSKMADDNLSRAARNLSSITHRYKTLFLIAAALPVFGCGGAKPVAKDPFFEKWSTMAEKSEGHTPAPQFRHRGIIPEIIGDKENGQETAQPESTVVLPQIPISVKFRQADVKTALRSLAKIVEMNIIVKNEIKGEITLDFTNVPWDQAFNGILNTHGLTFVREGDIIRIMTTDDLELNLKKKTRELGVRQVEPLLTVVVPISYAKPKELKETIESFLTRSKDDKPRGSVRVDEHSNSLIISAIRDDLERMMAIVEKIDRPTAQIMIKANIVETTKETARKLGIQWGGMYGHTVGNQALYVTPGGSGGTAVSPGSAFSGNYNPTSGASGIAGQGFGVNFPAAMTGAASGSLGLIFGSIGENILEMQLNALQSDSKLNILSSPSITTLDNQKAFTENGEKIPYSTIDTSVTPPTRTVKFEDAVLRLEITPHVIDGLNLMMKILVKKDEVDMSRTVEGNPFIIKKQTETTLIVKDGETIVISGLTKQRNALTTDGVPGLKDIPALGWLFKGEDKGGKMEEVLIFITPKILPSASDEKQPATKTDGKPEAEPKKK